MTGCDLQEAVGSMGARRSVPATLPEPGHSMACLTGIEWDVTTAGMLIVRMVEEIWNAPARACNPLGDTE